MLFVFLGAISQKMEEKIGKLKVKNETTTSQSSLDLYEKLQHLKREVHMRDEVSRDDDVFFDLLAAVASSVS